MIGNGPRDLEPSGDEMRRLVDRAMDRIVRHVASLPEQPAVDLDGADDVARSLREPLPETGRPFEDVLETLFERAVPKSFNTAGPGYLAYIPGGGLFDAALADLIADATNRYVGIYQAAPALVEIEANVIRWLCEVVGYPAATALGFLTTGGSLANLSAVIAARCERLPPRFQDGTVYVSDQAHHSVAKAARQAGILRENVRVLETDATFALRAGTVAAAVAADRARGLLPFLVVGSAGTTNTGAVDDLPGLADLAAREGLWLHVDAAYGGFFCLTERGRRALAGIERADSIALDPHKGLFLPYGTGCLLARDRATLARTFGETAAYLPASPEDPDHVDFSRISPELTRAFRGLRVYLPFVLRGARAFRAYLDEKLDLARLAAAELRRIPGLEIVAEPALSVVAFRLAAPDLPAEARDRRNRAFLDRIIARRRVYISGTTLRSGFTLRICVLSFRTHLSRVRAAMDDIRAAAAEVFHVD